MIAPGAMLLRGFALPFVEDILRALGDIAAQAPFRHMTTRWGAVMSVAMTNCGEVGWLTDRAGYRYDRIDPETGRQWPDMPGVLPGTGEPRRGSGRLPGLRAGCLPDQPLCAGHPADAASGQGRARLCAPDRLRVAGSFRPPSSSAEPKRRDPVRKLPAPARRCRRVGRRSHGSPIMALPSSRTASTRFSARCVST